MATIDLGRLGFVNKGTYNNSTTYEKNDLVQFTDGGILSTYLYIDSTAQSGQAPSSSGTAGSRWVYYAKGGAAGTDVGTTLTTQGDILYRDGSGLQRLAAGTNGQALLTGGAGANPSWGTISSPIQQFNTAISTTAATNSSTSSYIDGAPTISITPTATNNKIYVAWHVHVSNDSQSGQDNAFQFEIYRDSTLVYTSGTNFNYKYHPASGNLEVRQPVIFGYLDTTYNTTSAITYKYKFKNPHNTRSVSVNSSNTGHVKIFEF